MVDSMQPKSILLVLLLASLLPSTACGPDTDAPTEQSLAIDRTSCNTAVRKSFETCMASRPSIGIGPDCFSLADQGYKNCEKQFPTPAEIEIRDWCAENRSANVRDKTAELSKGRCRDANCRACLSAEFCSGFEATLAAEYGKCVAEPKPNGARCSLDGACASGCCGIADIKGTNQCKSTFLGWCAKI